MPICPGCFFFESESGECSRTPDWGMDPKRDAQFDQLRFRLSGRCPYYTTHVTCAHGMLFVLAGDGKWHSPKCPECDAEAGSQL